jgi:hypothetical protein
MMTSDDVKALLWRLALQIPKREQNKMTDLPKLIAALDWIDHATPPKKPRRAASKE